jgi:hypothetical protein
VPFPSGKEARARAPCLKHKMVIPGKRSKLFWLRKTQEDVRYIKYKPKYSSGKEKIKKSQKTPVFLYGGHGLQDSQARS